VGRGWWWISLAALIGRLHVALPQVDMDGIARLTPQLVSLEPDAVRRLAARRRGVGLDVRHGRDDVDAHDRTDVATYVTGAAGMTGRMRVAHAHAVADCELRLGGIRSGVGPRDAAVVAGERERATSGGFELVARQDAGFDHARGHAGDPVLVVRRCEVVRRIHAFDGVSKLTAVADAGQ